MIKYFFIVVALFFYCSPGHSSGQEAKLYYDQIEESPDDSSMMLSINRELENIQTYKKKIAYASKVLLIAKDKAYSLSKAKAHYILGTTYWAHAKYPDATYHLSQALEGYKTLGLMSPQAECFNTLGLTYFYVSNYADAIPFLDSALMIFKHQNDSSNISRVLNNQGLIYQNS